MNSVTSEQTVFVVDDDRDACESVAALVRSHGLHVESFSSAEEFLDSWRPNRRGCLLIDVRLPTINGLDLQQRLHDVGCFIPAIVITAFADVPTAIRAMQQGAITLLEKPSSNQKLWENIKLALELEEKLNAHARVRAEIENRRSQLTPGEEDVLQRLLTGKPNKVIAAELDMGLRTVELRRASIMAKMCVSSLAELVRAITAIETDSLPDGGMRWPLANR